MAEGWLRYFAGNSVQVLSAGTHPEDVNSYSINVMKSVGIDISHHRSNNINEYTDLDLDYLITLCDNALEVCPNFPSTVFKEHYSLKDPAKTSGNEIEKTIVYRLVRDQIKDYIRDFVDNKLLIQKF